MNWKLITKDKKNQPEGDDYSKWKEQIASECYHQCVYCAIHESPWGGIDHYHIDHYRPKSKPAFKKFELDICNLFYACPVCNRFKSDDWPGEPNSELSTSCYPDPSKTDYSTIFQIRAADFNVQGLNIAAKYVIERLYLNRPQLIYERREDKLSKEERMIRKSVLELLKQISDVELIKKVVSIIDKILDLMQSRKSIRPYQLAEIRKQKV